MEFISLSSRGSSIKRLIVVREIVGSSPAESQHKFSTLGSCVGNSRYICNICTVLDQRRIRWTDVVQYYTNVSVFDGMADNLWCQTMRLHRSDMKLHLFIFSTVEK